MTEDELLQKLNTGRLSKRQIVGLVEELVKYPSLTECLLREIFRQDKLNEFNASWVFDHLMRKQLAYILPHINEFTSKLENLTSESCIRPMAHICQMLCESYFVKNDAVFKNEIKTAHLEHLVNACFDWLIGEHKMAAKVFSMTSLLYLGEKFEWIHPELKIVLENTIAKGSAGYKHRAKKTLLALNSKSRAVN
ncbi:adenylosuccinate lyase [Croceitalea rosinachiae]|uniref:Adenylosuccinate lyase n=1 Tax=Croceitalea rosinachiae TaxID=3075596 RepID=A0ABU3AAK0_9FLAO|nr:adenylosuccinate lyase [Croceitalea sp. F388]MDT0607211.1 adenylosuccinate lyase [Croceitalea sp. F388]